MRFACLLIFSAGCGEATTGDIQFVVLRDVHGMWGGRNLFVFADGTTYVEHVEFKEDGGLETTRYRIQTSAAELTKLVNDYDVFSIRTEDRYGVPDESSPEITVRLTNGPGRTVRKWANDTHEQFDAIYKRLMEIANAAKSTRSFFQGPFDWKWAPPR